MNNKNQGYIFFSFFLILVVALTSCKHEEGEYHSIIDKIKNKSKNYHGVTLSSESYLGDDKMIKITEDGHTFLIPERKGKLKSFKCSECHSKPLSQINDEDLKKAHWDIKIVNANEKTMNCLTCHNSNNMDELKSITGKSIDFNRSYNLCNQCHTKQFDDWKGGAHGKRIGGWAPPRASLSCVNCHNPHNPSFEKKWPERYNSQKTKERK